MMRWCVRAIVMAIAVLVGTAAVSAGAKIPLS